MNMSLHKNWKEYIVSHLPGNDHGSRTSLADCMALVLYRFLEGLHNFHAMTLSLECQSEKSVDPKYSASGFSSLTKEGNWLILLQNSPILRANSFPVSSHTSIASSAYFGLSPVAVTGINKNLLVGPHRCKVPQ